MFEELIPITFLVVVAFIMVGMTRIISDGITQRKLILSGTAPEVAEAIRARPKGGAALDESLRWGLVTGSVGLAFILIQFLPYEPNQPIAVGTILLFAAGGLLAYYAAARRRTTG